MGKRKFLDGVVAGIPSICY